jgi:hypothetical protein
MRQLCDLKVDPFRACDDITDVLSSSGLLGSSRLLDIRLEMDFFGESDLNWLVVVGLA